MNEKIDLFIKYMKKEREIMTEFDREDGVDVDSNDYKLRLSTVDRIKSFIAYRNIRTEEAYFIELNMGKNFPEKNRLIIEYNDNRSTAHTKALKSMLQISEFGKINGLPEFYDGELLKAQDIEVYKNIDIRKKETDFFLHFINDLDNMSMSEIKEILEKNDLNKENPEFGFIQELRQNLESVNRSYGVEEPLIEDDGDIKFKDSGKFGEYGNY